MAVEPWTVRVHDLILGSLAPSTRVSYDRKVRELRAFCLSRGLAFGWPLSVSVVLQFLLHLYESGLHPRSIAIYISAFAFTAGVRGVLDVTRSFRVRRMLEGMRRARPSAPDQRRPVTVQVLTGLFEAFGRFCSSDFERDLFRAVTVIMFFGAFRVSEVLVRARRADPAWVLWWSDLTMDAGGLSLRLRRSKTDQRAFGTLVRLRAMPHHPLCPVRALTRYRNRVLHYVGPLFQHADGEPLTIYQFRVVFSMAITAMGLSPRMYSVHSLRIGAATLAAGLGLPEEVIRRIGRWRSNAFKLYVRRGGHR